MDSVIDQLDYRLIAPQEDGFPSEDGSSLQSKVSTFCRCSSRVSNTPRKHGTTNTELSDAIG